MVCKHTDNAPVVCRIIFPLLPAAEKQFGKYKYNTNAIQIQYNANTIQIQCKYKYNANTMSKEIASTSMQQKQR